VIRNLTAQRYGVAVPAGQSETLTYSFATELHPQDLRLSLAAVIQDTKGNVFTKMVYNETVSVVEAPVSFFDPQMYVYLHLTATRSSTSTLLTYWAIVSSSTSSSRQPSAVPATSSTIPGSRPSSPKSVAVERAASARRGLRVVVERWTQLIRLLSLALMARLSRAVRRLTMNLGSRLDTCRGQRLGELGVGGRRAGLRRCIWHLRRVQSTVSRCQQVRSRKGQKEPIAASCRACAGIE